MKTIRTTFPKIRTYLLRRKRRYEVDARGNGVGHRYYFTDRKAAVQKARELADLSQRSQSAGVPTPLTKPHLLERLVSLLENQRVTPTTTDRKLPDLLKEWVAARKDDKFRPLRPRSFTTIMFTARRLMELFGPVPLLLLDRNHVEKVFSRQSWSPQSLKNYRGLISQFFNWCIRQGYLTQNPVQHLHVATIPIVVEVYRLSEVRTIFAKLQQPPFMGLIPYYALGLFAGVRPLEVARMTWGENVHLPTQEIEIQGDIAKTKRPRRFTMEPVLFEWLKWYRDTFPTTPLICHNFSRLQRRFQSELGFRWIADGLRHTFGTYHYNRDKSLGALTFVMGNSEVVARKHYLTSLPQGDVNGYWEIKPARSS